MKKVIISCVILLALTGCVTQQERIERAQRLATELEESKDVIKTIETYNNMYAHCFSSDFSHKRNGNLEEFGLYREICDRETIQELSNPQIDLSCFYKNWSTETEYKSDKCIIQRRNYSLSKNGYFDYKRFLPKNDKIKSADDWNILVTFYNDDVGFGSAFHKIKYCDGEMTSYEKQACQTNKEQTTIKLATTKIRCKDAYNEKQYRLVLSDMLEFCGYFCNLRQVGGWMKNWGKEHLCDIDGYRSNEFWHDVNSFSDYSFYVE